RTLYYLKILMKEQNLILLNKPTNDLDIQTLSILEDYLEQLPGVVITVSHDRYFLDQVVNELLVFDGKGGIEHIFGNYSDYAEQVIAEVPKKTEKPKSQKVGKENKKTKLSYHEQKEWDTIEDDITALEENLTEIETKIAENSNDIEQVQRFYEEQQVIEAQLEEKMERWEELSLLVESFQK